MIDNYNDDKKMAQLGRDTAKSRAIRKAREELRDMYMTIDNARSLDALVSAHKAFLVKCEELIGLMQLWLNAITYGATNKHRVTLASWYAFVLIVERKDKQCLI